CQRGDRDLTAGDGGQDRDRVPFLDLGFERSQVPNVLVVDVDVDEPVQSAVVGEDVPGDPGVLHLEVVQDVGQRVAVGVHLRLTVGVLAQDRGELDCHGHVVD